MITFPMKIKIFILHSGKYGVLFDDDKFIFRINDAQVPSQSNSILNTQYGLVHSCMSAHCIVNILKL